MMNATFGIGLSYFAFWWYALLLLLVLAGLLTLLLLRRQRRELRAEAERQTAALLRRQEQMAALQRLTEAESEEARLLTVAAAAARPVLGAQALAIFIRSGAGPQGAVHCAACDGVAERLAPAQQAAVSVQGPGLLAEALREGRTTGVGVRAPAAAPLALAEGWLERSALVIPLATATPDSAAAGAMVWLFDGCEPVGPAEAVLAEEIGRRTSASLRRVRLIAQTNQRADELILLNEVGHLLVESPALEGTLRRIAELVCRHFQLAGAGFLLLDESRQALVTSALFGDYSPAAAAGLRMPLQAQAVTTLAFRQNQTLTIENAATDPRVGQQFLQVLPGAVSGAIVPMSGAGGQAGVFGVWKKQPYVFQPRELQSLGGVARLAAAAVWRDELLRALRASEKRLQEVVDGIHAILVSIDPQGNILSFNAAAERMVGRKQSEVLGQRLAAVATLNAGERAKLELFTVAAFATLDCSQELVLHWPAREGGERKIRWRSSFLRSPDGKVTGMVCLGVDITEQTLLEAQLLQAQKMESVGALAGGMAHDFNNLLGGIIGQCAVARSQTGDEPILAALTHIESAAHRGADLTGKLMTFARKSVLQPRAVDLGTLIKETAALLSGSLPHSIQLVSTVAPELPLVYGDATQLQQVLVNLCVNARDAMPNGGTLTIRATPAPAAASGGVLVEVADTGTGMSEDVQEHIFEPFFTTKLPGKGTGLGLSMVFGILRSHGGQITCRSAVGQGTSFRIRLPPARRPSSKGEKAILTGADSHGRLVAVAAGAPQPSPQAQRARLLLVDDDAILRETVGKL
ncbi:MAG: ATP-binding protein, partial [Planctomycetota bacterium]